MLQNLKRWGAPALCLALAGVPTVGAWVMVVQPVLVQRSEAESAIGGLGEAESELARLDRSLAVARRSAEALKLELADMPSRLGRIEDLNLRIADVLELAESLTLPVQQVRPGTNEPSEWFARLPLRITAKADYPTLRMFCARLHHRFPDMQISGINLTPDSISLPTENNADGPTLAAVIDVDWFTALEQPGVGAGGGTRGAGSTLAGVSNP